MLLEVGRTGDAIKCFRDALKVVPASSTAKDSRITEDSPLWAEAIEFSTIVQSGAIKVDHAGATEARPSSDEAPADAF